MTMVAGVQTSKLIQLVGIEGDFPFYGEIILENQKSVTKKVVEEELINKGKIWVSPELLITLNIKIGDTIKLGNTQLKIGDVYFRIQPVHSILSELLQEFTWEFLRLSKLVL